MTTFESATARLDRLLTLVPWLMTNQGIDLAEVAASFDVSQEQIVDDLQLLFVCGTPGHMPDDLIEASWEGGKLYVGNADTIATPLRLGRDEALALIVALRALAASTDPANRDAIDRALMKLEQASGESGNVANRVSFAVEDDQDAANHLERLRSALSDHRRVSITYLAASRDESTERDVDPMRVVQVGGYWYLEGWCHRAYDVRLFRLDRIEALTVLDQDGTPPEHATSRPIGPGVFRPSEQDELVLLVLEPSAAWVVEQFPVESVVELADGYLEVGIRVADPQWLTRLIWRLGGQARVVSPASLVESIRHAAQTALALG